MSDIVSLQNEDGSFSGDMWGEIDTRYFFLISFFLKLLLSMYELTVFLTKIHWTMCIRFSYIAICCLSILRRLHKINVEKAVKYIISCKNMDGGFGCTPGGESHAGQSRLYNIHDLYLNITSSMFFIVCTLIPFEVCVVYFFSICREYVMCSGHSLTMLLKVMNTGIHSHAAL